MADDAFAFTKVRTIDLPKLDPKGYRFWVKQAESRLAVFQCLGIVLGTETRPEPAAEGQAITQAMRKARERWDAKHSLVKEALLNCVDTSLVSSIYNLESAADMWKKLQTEYGTKSLEEHTRA